MLNRSILVALTIVCISSGQQSGARFLLWHPSAKSISMGGIGVAIDNGVFAAYYNPASLGFINKTSISTSFGQPFPFFENMGHSFIGFSHNFKFGVMAFSANMFWRERQLRTGEMGYNFGLDGEKFSYVKPNSSDLKQSISSLIVDNLSFGINISLLNNNLVELGGGAEKGKGKSTIGLIGVGFRMNNISPNLTFLSDRSEIDLNRGLSLGIVYQNIGPQIIFIDADQADKPPTLIKIGLAYFPIILNNYSLLVSTDFEKQLNEKSVLDFIHIGVELGLFNTIFLRSGYFNDMYEPMTSYHSFGAGLKYRKFEFNVAWYQMTIVPAWHFELSYGG